MEEFLLDSSFFIIMIIFIQIIFLVLFIIIVRTIIMTIKRRLSNNFFKKSIVVNEVTSNNKIKKVYNDVSKGELSEFNIEDINDLKNFFYDIFVEFENAYNNLDYNKMKILSTKQLYNNYYTGINLNLKSGKKRIIKNIERKNVIIYELFSSMLKQTASVMIEVSYINYMQDKTGKVMSGNPVEKITEKFEVEFRKEFEKHDITECPTCGAEIIGNKCEFCRSYVKSEEFKINSIKRIIDK